MASADPLAPLGEITVTLLFASAPRLTRTLVLALPAGATVRQAWAASGLAPTLGARLDADGPDGLRLALWGRLCEPDQALQHGDRLDLLRPLLVEPMLARRQRLLREGLPKPARPGAGGKNR